MHSKVSLKKLEPCLYSPNTLWKQYGDKSFKEKWVTKQRYIKDMNDEIKLKFCNYVYIYVNVLRNQDFKEFLFKETVTNNLCCKFTLKLTSWEYLRLRQNIGRYISFVYV